jgi:hypothetical protein
MESGTSISKFDKQCLDYAAQTRILNANLSKIKFKETLAYVGRLYLELDNTNVLPTKSATDVLRICSVYSGGDEGLKTNTKFKNPNAKQRKILRETLDQCYDLEESFKNYREKWLRFLYYLNPMAKANSGYKTLARYSNALRNKPKTLETFNAKVERMIKDKNSEIFDLLEKRKGVFTRRLDHLVRVFGQYAIERYLQCDIEFDNLVTAYNHFTTRDKEQAGRGAILASQDQSQLVTYKSLVPLNSKLVSYIKESILKKLADSVSPELSGKVFTLIVLCTILL